MTSTAQFERAAQSAWTSKCDSEQKRLNLLKIHLAIQHYVKRMDDQRRTANPDPWTARSFDRMRGYLTHLAADVQDLALQCEGSKVVKA